MTRVFSLILFAAVIYKRQRNATSGRHIVKWKKFGVFLTGFSLRYVNIGEC